MTWSHSMDSRAMIFNAKKLNVVPSLKNYRERIPDISYKKTAKFLTNF